MTLRVAAPSNISVGPESLLFRHTPAATISQQVLNVGGPSTGIRFNVTFATDSGGTWLRVNPLSGTNAASAVCLGRQHRIGAGNLHRIDPCHTGRKCRRVPLRACDADGAAGLTALTVDQSQLTFNAPDRRPYRLARPEIRFHSALQLPEAPGLPQHLPRALPRRT